MPHTQRGAVAGRGAPVSFRPIIPIGGLAGWSFLNRTMEQQRSAFEQTGSRERELAYFRRNIGKVTSAEELVADRRLLAVALGAFGLDDDIGNKYFIQRVLEDGTLDEDALANRLSDKSYLKLSRAFGFGDFPVANTQLSDFPDRIIDAFKTRQFEIAVGQTDPDMRLAMNITRELGDLAAKDTSDDAKWFTVMGSEPMRQVFETAFGLPAAFAALDIDKQLEVFRERSGQAFGDSGVSQFTDEGRREELVQLFLARAQIAKTSASLTPASTALMLLQSAVN